MAPRKIPASIILAPRELKHFRRWQNLYTTRKPSEQMCLPTAVEYHDFQQWLRRQDSGYFSDVFDDLSDYVKPIRNSSSTGTIEHPYAVVCHHAMHPITAGQLRSRCPVCTVDLHLTYVRVLTEALKAVGGRPPSCTLTASDHQVTVYEAWSQGKIGALQELSNLEVMAAKEAEWASQHPNFQLHEVQTASMALDLYWFEHGGYIASSISKKTETLVVFAGDTVYEPGRPQAYYWTRSPRYEPGKYTCEDGQMHDGEDDVSEDSEDYYHAPVSQVKSAAETGPKPSSLTSPDEPHSPASTDDYDAIDGEGEWEDSDEEGLDDEDSEGGFIHFEIEIETSFIIFADD